MRPLETVLARTSAYAPVTQVKSSRIILISCFLVTLASSARTLSIVLLVRAEHTSFSFAGSVVAASSVGAAFLAPVRGRLVDRYGQTRVLLGMIGVHAASWFGLAAGIGHLQPELSVVLALIGGASFPPVFACTRSTWAHTFAGDQEGKRAAYALTSMTQNAALVLGAPAAALAATDWSPTAGLLLAVSTTVVGTIMFAATSLSRSVPVRQPTARSGWLGPLVEPRILVLMVGMLFYGCLIGTINITVPAVAIRTGSHLLAGYLLSLFAVGDIVGAFIYGSRRWKGPPAIQISLSFSAVLVSGIILAVWRSSPEVLGLGLIMMGLLSSPILINFFHLLDDVAPRGTETESFTWAASGQLLGVALGASVAGYGISHGPAYLFFVPACIAAVVGGTVFVTLHRTLTPSRPDRAVA